jgi:hypothetical protein
MPRRLHRHCGAGYLQLITASCYKGVRYLLAGDLFLKAAEKPFSAAENEPQALKRGWF